MSTITDFLIDISDNMSKKLPVAQKAIKDEIIPLLDFSETIGMRTFLSIVKSPIVINSIDLGITNKHDFTEKIEKLPIPNGGSPIGYTIQKSLSALKENDADKKRIILVTAGMETDGGNYEFEVEKAERNSHVQVNIIGLGLSGFEEKTAQKVADLSNGTFCNIPLEKSNDEFAVKSTLQPLIDILNGKESSCTEQKPEQKAEEIQIEKKEEIIVETKQEMAIFCQETKEEKAEPIKEMVKETVPENEHISTEKEAESSQKKTFVIFEDNNPIDSNIFASKDNEENKIDTIKQIEAKNAEIINILNENIKAIQGFLCKEKETKEEIEILKNAGKESIKKIANLKGINKNAQSEINRLEVQIADKEDVIKELQNLQATDKEEIRRLKKIDEEVILFEDKEKTHSNSQKSEEITYQLLQKKYPGRVNWINKAKKEEKGYDFEIIFDNENVEYYIACKGKADSSKTFFLTKQEWELCLKNNRNYQVYLVNDINGNPKITIIDNLMGWILNGKVRPYAPKNQKVKSERIMFTLIG